MTDQADICPGCGGTGRHWAVEERPYPCPVCHGTGRISNETPTEPLQAGGDVTKPVPDSPPPLQESLEEAGSRGRGGGENLSQSPQATNDEQNPVTPAEALKGKVFSEVTISEVVHVPEEIRKQLRAEGARAELKAILSNLDWSGSVVPSFGSANGGIIAGSIKGYLKKRLAALDKQENQPDG